MDFIFSRQNGARVSDKLFYKDLRLVVIENDVLRVVVTPDKGADIVSFVDKATGVDVMLRLPTGLRSPKSEVALTDREHTLFSYYEGGWQELFPVGSSFGKYHKADMPVHGETPLLSWDHAILEDSPSRVSVEFRVRTLLTPFELKRRMTVDASSPEVWIEETVENLSTMDLEYMWGHHPAFGAPFLSGDCRIELPKCRLINGSEKLLRIPPQKEPRRAMFYAADLKRGVYGIHNDHLGFGFGMRWDARVFPKMWIWQSMHAQQTAPYFQREYACAIEPFTSLPHQLFGKKDPLPVLQAGQRLQTSLAAFLYRGALPGA